MKKIDKRKSPFTSRKLCIKRSFDLFGSIIGIFLLVPVFLVVSIIHKFVMPGPIIYKQKRVGQFGEIFTLYKIRTMNISYEGNTITTRGEKRITPYGAILRKSKLDELPGLWNIIRGDMSFVGPRPDVPGYADRLAGEERNILDLKPGITGPASVKYANEELILAQVENPEHYNDTIIYPDKVKINLDYYYNWSLRLDLLIIYKTIFRKNYQ
jgi:lipopolysaccharide/colanic/teichoic acid biosynthesis glycosyltransferase